MALATVSEVRDITGVSINKDAITRAQSVLSVLTNVVISDDLTLSTRDTYWLKMAVCYQVAWMDGHPEMFSAMDVSSMTQIDLSVTFRDDPAQRLLAPLARAALDRCSWARSRSIEVKNGFAGLPDDDTGVWRAI